MSCVFYHVRDLRAAVLRRSSKILAVAHVWDEHVPVVSRQNSSILAHGGMEVESRTVREGRRRPRTTHVAVML